MNTGILLNTSLGRIGSVTTFSLTFRCHIHYLQGLFFLTHTAPRLDNSLINRQSSQTVNSSPLFGKRGSYVYSKLDFISVLYETITICKNVTRIYHHEKMNKLNKNR